MPNSIPRRLLRPFIYLNNKYSSIKRAAHGKHSLRRRRRLSAERLETRDLLAIDLEWAFASGNSGQDWFAQTALDPDGNLYAAGSFQGTVDFQPGAEVIALTANPGQHHGVVAKYDPDGKLLWVRQFVGQNLATGPIAVDAAGQVVVAGNYQGSFIDLNPDPDAEQLHPVGGWQNGFVVKLDNNGNFIWGTTPATNSSLSISDIAIAESNRIVLTGAFSGNVSFGSASLGPSAANDIFIWELNSDGQHFWVGTIGGPGFDGSSSLAATPDGGLVLTGYYGGWQGHSIDVDPDPQGVHTLPGVGGSDAFIVKLDTQRRLAWAGRISSSNDVGTSWRLAADHTGSVLVSGHFRGLADFVFPSGTISRSSSAFQDAYLLKLDADGNIMWLNTLQGGAPNGQANLLHVAVNATGAIYAAGTFFGPFDFDPDPSAAHTMTPYGSHDIFLLALDSAGHFQWSERFGGTAIEVPYGLTVSNAGELYLSGYIESPADFATSSQAPYLLPFQGWQDMFLARYFTPNAPPVIDSLSLDTQVVEGQGATLHGRLSDSGQQDEHVVLVEWGDGETTTIELPQGDREFTFQHLYRDDNPSGTDRDDFVVRVVVTDSKGGRDEATASISVLNVAPAISHLITDASQCGNIREGQKVTLSGIFVDPGLEDTFTAKVDWGDGNETMAIVDVTTRSFTAAHTYSAGGIFEITVTLRDDDLGQTSSQTTAIVTGVGLHQGLLQIVGSAGSDHVVLMQQGVGVLRVQASFLETQGRTKFFSEDLVTYIMASLCDGDDQLVMAGTVNIPALLDGGAGDDHLRAGRAGSILIGGPGSDELVGNGASDLLIGGITLYEHQVTAQRTLLTEWSSRNSYEDRVANLRRGGGLAPAPIRLQAGVTVLDDHASDVLQGGKGRDWFFADLDGADDDDDQVIDRELQELIDLL